VPGLDSHKALYLPQTLTRTQDALEVASADGLLAEIEGLHAINVAVLEKAELAGQLRIALVAIREARANLELVAKLVAAMA
jgi:hypothetical protein